MVGFLFCIRQYIRPCYNSAETIGDNDKLIAVFVCWFSFIFSQLTFVTNAGVGKVRVAIVLDVYRFRVKLLEMIHLTSPPVVSKGIFIIQTVLNILVIIRSNYRTSTQLVQLCK